MLLKKNEIQAHARAIAALLYEEADAEQVQTLAGIEDTVRAQLLKHVSPEIGVFFIETSSGTTRGRRRLCLHPRRHPHSPLP